MKKSMSLVLFLGGCNYGLAPLKLSDLDDTSIAEDSAEASSEVSTEPAGEPAGEPSQPDTDEPSTSENPLTGDCSDGIDNDQDGAIDCNDSDCVGADVCRDMDGDGYTADVDCDDSNSGVFPGATEVANDGIDQDCDGQDYEYGNNGTDADGDGYTADSDCDDNDVTINPGAYDVPDDGVDQDCNGSDATTGGNGGATDADFDGYDVSVDCDDNDFYTRPGAGYLDSSTACMTDGDFDGYGDAYPSNPAVTPGTDCNDTDSFINPGASDSFVDGVDQNCDGVDGTGGGSGGACTLDAVISSSGTGLFSSSTFAVNNQADGSCSSYNTEEFLLEWTAPNTGCATIDTNGSVDDTVLSVYDACPSLGGYELSCDDDSGSSTQSSLDLDVTGFTTYYIAIEGYSTTPSSVMLNIAMTTTSCGSGTGTTDNDFDGYDSSVDCNDNDSTIYPGAYDPSGDGIDQDCDGVDGTGGSTGSCCFTLNMYDSWGDGWNGASLDAYENYQFLASYTISYGSSYTQSICLSPGSYFTMDFYSGSYDSEISYEFYDPSGLLLLSQSNPTAGNVYTNSSVTCP